MAENQMDLVKIMWEAGWVVKFVLLLLFGASVFSWAIIFKKRKVTREVFKNNDLFLKIYHGGSNLKEIMSEAQDLPFSPLKIMYIEGYQELMKFKDKMKSDEPTKELREHFKVFGLGAIERALQKGMIKANKRLSKYLSSLASIGSVTPFVGLFGTVWGIIDSFTGLASGGATLDAVAPGIAEALVATAIGLFAAIPAVWFFNHFSNENTKIASEMDEFGQEFVNLVERTLLNK